MHCVIDGSLGQSAWRRPRRGIRSADEDAEGDKRACGEDELVRLLVAAGADVNARYHRSWFTLTFFSLVESRPHHKLIFTPDFFLQRQPERVPAAPCFDAQP